ncbi:putative circadian clock protein, KaiC [Methanohalobium evestigatum Z-7303]|uniref:Putative circadian clock protein, KaiC n=1 Tax=Methanohalobium evestigatum (strain ATCC BAA-1072 / DSM 3721 / NBRC 107634 / OCM 161 / Z-7303) TaxID=644295 RepID=D7E6Z3_METEZ|nr:ATPase domain-containing protein [Methanohalobium evestigatum]ADI73617.1 putative circadian clock protein, KaiC [Methanohalobium evestigatum Z-7303]
MDEDRIPTGIAGLDRVIEGGLRDNTTLLVVGSSGTGKSTFAMQYIMYGLENGENALYVSLEEPPEQILEEAEKLGFDMKKYHERELFFFHTKGEDFKQLVEEQLPALVEANKDYSVRTRVVIDPLTPLIWSISDKKEQRELITKLFYTLKQLGAVLVTTEEHSAPGETIGEDVLIPVYLSDGAVHLTYRPIGGAFNRSLEIIKMRATRHGEEVYPYIFVRGIGVVAKTTPVVSPEDANKYDGMFDKAIKTASDLGASEMFLDKIRYVKKHWSYSFSPKETLQMLFETYGLTQAIKKDDVSGSENVDKDNTSSSQSEQSSNESSQQTTESFDKSDEENKGGEGDTVEIEDLSELEELAG